LYFNIRDRMLKYKICPPIMRRLTVAFGLPIVAVCSVYATQSVAPASSVPVDSSASLTAGRATLDRYCITCHNQKRPTADLALDTLDLNNVAQNARTLEKVAARLRSRTMPPVGLPRPDRSTYDAVAGRIEAALDTHSAAHPDPGRPVIHRLNRAEYANAVRDLLSLEVDVRALLPADDSGYGFDNISDVLSLSPALLERYMTAAGKISRLAVGDAAIRPAVQTYTVPQTLLQRDRMSEAQPFGTRGGAAVRHYFPADGEYEIRVQLQRTHASQIRGLGEPNAIELRLDRRRVRDFSVGGEGPRDPWSAVPSASRYEQTADEKLTARLAITAGPHDLSVAFPEKSGLPEGARQPELSVATYEYAGDRDEAMGVATIEISGPFGVVGVGDTPSRRRIFVCREDKDACAATILRTLARRAYRRPVGDADVAALMQFYRAGRSTATLNGSNTATLNGSPNTATLNGSPSTATLNGSPYNFDAGIEFALRAMLVDPDFLFFVERDPAGAARSSLYRVNDIQLASRLSLFLWSSIPDDELLALAEQQRLSDPAVLGRQVERMLADPRAAALVRNFAGQWLHLRNMRSVTPDPEAFPEFDENLRDALRQETELFIQDQIRHDRGVLELLTAGYTFLNERLAKHYGIPGIWGSQFRRVEIADSARRGLLGQGSILTVTSYANRTSPTLRGKWVLENLLAAPPPAPPPNVPGLDEGNASDGLSVRERMEQHRRNPVCASCHAPMDPFGLALENFDAVGKWRTRDGQAAIDASTSLPDGSSFDGPDGLRKLLAAEPDRFAAAVTEKLLTYALGRGVEYYDRPAIRRILRDAKAGGYTWSSLVAGIVRSTPFQMRRASES
jgi:mono/diheme cytochrome c family protein